MHFNEFMEMVAGAARKHKNVLTLKEEEGAAGRAPTSREIGGLYCQVYLREDGSVSTEQTGLSVCFTVRPPDA